MKAFDKQSLFFAKAQNKLKFFAELGLANLPEDKKDQIWTKFVELVSLEVLDKTLDQLSEKDQQQLFLNLAKNPKDVERFFAKNKKLRKITLQAISKIKNEIFTKFTRK